MAEPEVPEEDLLATRTRQTVQERGVGRAQRRLRVWGREMDRAGDTRAGRGPGARGVPSLAAGTSRAQLPSRAAAHTAQSGVEIRGQTCPAQVSPPR